MLEAPMRNFLLKQACMVAIRNIWASIMANYPRNCGFLSSEILRYIVYVDRYVLAQ